MIPLAMRLLRALLVLALLPAAPAPARAQLFFAATPSPDLRIAPLMIRASVTPAGGPVQVRVVLSVMTTAGAPVPDIYLLWPGEVKGDPKPGPRDAALAEHVTALGYDVIDEGRLLLRARRLSSEAASVREPIAGGAPYVTFVQTGGALGLSAPATWIRLPSTPRLSDPDWMVVLEVPSLSVVK